MLVIITKSPTNNLFSLEYYKVILRSIFAKSRGPQAVLQSLTKGLNELNYIFKLNPARRDIKKADTVIVNSSIDALSWAIAAKSSGEIKKLIAGPNLVVSPLDEDSILCNQSIDLIIVPSQWVKDFYISLAPEIADKIFVWPAGVDVPDFGLAERVEILLYVKNTADDLLSFIEKQLKNQGFLYKKLVYGNFKKDEYFKALNRSQAMIYISNSESQGLALFEAWARNVPTMAWSRGYFEYGKFNWKNKNISAPYMTDQTGEIFTGAGDFNNVLYKFLRKIKIYAPRDFVLNDFTNIRCAEKLLRIINE